MVAVAENLFNARMSFAPSLHAMLDTEFARWVELLGKRIGVRNTVLRKSFLINKLTARMQKLGLHSYQQYFDYLHTGAAGEIEWIELIDTLTVQETRFLRHSSSMQLVANYCRTRIVDSTTSIIPIQAWSIGCATGEEVYTLAMVIDQALQGSPGQASFCVIGSDINQSSLLFARRGIYHRRQLTNLNEELVQTYFLPDKKQYFKIRSELQEAVCFVPVNVLHIEQSPIGCVDIIFCQNLLIYFEHDDRLDIVNKLVEYLSPNGILILGAGEIHQWYHRHLERIESDDTLAFRKIC